MSDTSNQPTLRIKRRGEEVNLFILGGVLLVVGVLFAMGLLSSRRGADTSVGAGYVILIFAVASLIWGAIIKKRGPNELIMSPSGLHDPQLLEREIPWSEFSGMDITNAPKPVINFRTSKATLKDASYATIGKLLHGTNGRGAGIGYANIHFIDALATVVQQIDVYMSDLALAKGNDLFGKPDTAQ